MKCRYTGIELKEGEYDMLPSPMPQANILFPVARTPEAKALRKAEFVAFNDMDANCNTCKHFNRLKNDNEKGSNSASNFVYGNCKNNGQIDLIPYKADGYQIMVHVADYLGIPCYQQRT